MNRRVCLLVPFVASFVSICFAGYPTKHYLISAMLRDGKAYRVGVKDGELVLAEPDVRSRLSGKDAYDKWYVLGTKIKSSLNGRYLAYDLSGKTGRVFLVATAEGEETDWSVRRGKGPQKNEIIGSESWGTIQAASGPMKDWYFDIEEAAEKRDDGKLVDVRRFVLSKRPNIEVGRIYTSDKGMRDRTPSQIK